jgi:acyl-homoserine lactone acylase PvdQ
VTRLMCSVLAFVVLFAAPARTADIARYILPPGDFGGFPLSPHSTDQLPLYSGLSPLRDNITQADIDAHFLPEDFSPIGATEEEVTGRAGVKILYDAYGIPHVYGDTRADMAFGAGWTTARDRGLLLQLGRGPARVAVADVPNVDAFSLVTSGQTFTASAAAEDLVTQQVRLLVDTYGEKGREIIADAQAYADGINAYWDTHGGAPEGGPATVNDVIAVTAFIGSIFGAGGGGEAANADLLAKLQGSLGADQGYKAWSDVMLADDPEAPTTITRRFDYPVLTGGPVTGSVVLDAGSIQSIDPHTPAMMAALAPARLRASNFLVVAPTRSASGHSLAVMGPQLGYYYPEIVQQIDLHGPGISAQGAAVPGLAMYILIGRTQDYAWSLTSAGHDVRDVYAEQLCEPDNSAPTRASTHYLFNGQCRAMDTFDAGTLGTDTELVYNVTVHGSVFATATIGGKPYGLSRRRSTFGRDGLNLGALKDMTEGRARTPSRFWRIANQFGFTFNWAYVSRRRTAYFTSGYLPRRPPGLDRRLPTLGTGQYEWTGFLTRNRHPHDVYGPGGILINWNNRSAPGFMHGDDEPYGSFQRVEMFNRFPAAVQITDDVGIMNRAATQDVRSPVWPLVSRVLRTGTAPTPRDQQVVDVLDEWVSRDAPRIDADADTLYDDAGPVIMDALWRPVADAVMSSVIGAFIPDLDRVRDLDGMEGESYVDKDLRTLLGDPVQRRPLAGGPPGRGRARGAAGPAGPEPLAEARGDDGVRPGALAEPLPVDEPADVPAGARVRAVAGAPGSRPADVFR